VGSISSAEEEFLKELRAIEAKWQRKWEEAKIFEADPDPSRPKFFITVPYPYTSGALHIGHGRTYTIGDIVARYMRMKGYNVLWPMAFHITGTPIASISTRIARGDGEAIKLYESYVRLYVKDDTEVKRILTSFKKPENVANFFAKVISNDFKSLGYSIDWRRKFSTGDPEYNAFVTWQFLKLREKGYLTRGKHAVLYCPNDKSAVGEDDISGGDQFRPEVKEYTAVKFKWGNSYLVASTLRPETIFGVTNLWVNPKAKYVKALIDGEKWIISKRALSKLIYQFKEVKELEEINVKELLGSTCLEPVNGREIPILPADFVNDEEATGIVYSVPAHAPYDYIALMELRNSEFRAIAEGLSPINVIRIEGYGEWPAAEVVKKLGIRSQRERDKLEEATRLLYKAEYYKGVMGGNCGPFAGLRVSEAKLKVREWLEDKGIASTVYETSPLIMHCRCGARIVVAVLEDQWFINYGDPEWKERAFRALNRITIYPVKYRKLFVDTFNWLSLRPAARKRGLGTRLPFDREWIIESLSDSTIYMAFYTIIHKIRKYGIKPEALKPEFFDYVFLGIGSLGEVSKSTGITPEVLKDLRDEFTYWYPVDLRHTSVGHVTNHLSFFIFHHVAIFPEELWPKMITINEYVTREGVKMSKSKGNILPLVEIPRKYSADLYRLYIVYAADLSSTVDWREREVLSVLYKLRQFWALANSIISTGLVRKPTSLSLQSRWLLSKFNRAILSSEECLKGMKLREYVQEAFFNVLNYLNEYERMACNVGEEEKAWVKRRILEDWIKILSPVIPHICEELWSKLGKVGFVAKVSWPKAKEEEVDLKLEEAVGAVKRTIEDIRELTKLVRIGSTGRVYIYVGSEDWKYKALGEIMKAKERDLKELVRKVLLLPFIKDKREAVELVKKALKGRVALNIPNREYELRAFRTLSKYIEREVGLNIVVEDALAPSYDPLGRAKLSEPGRPAIYLEGARPKE